MKSAPLAALLLAATLLPACTNTIKYDDQSLQKAVTNSIGLDQFQKSTQSMVDSLLTSPGVQNATRGQRPRLAVFGLVDFTGENIDIQALNNGMFSQLGQSARFNFADPASLTRADQQQKPNRYDLLEDPAAARALSQAVSADYLLVGEISNIVRTQPAEKQVWYRVSLKLVDTRNNRFLWQENREFLKSQKKIVYGI